MGDALSSGVPASFHAIGAGRLTIFNPIVGHELKFVREVSQAATTPKPN